MSDTTQVASLSLSGDERSAKIATPGNLWEWVNILAGKLAGEM
jgi:hypothetical protein